MNPRLLLLLLLWYAPPLRAQDMPVNPVTNKVTYTEVVPAGRSSKQELFDKARKWVMAKDSPNNPYLIAYEDETEGSIIGKGSFLLPAARRKYAVLFTVKISVKQGRCKYEFSDLIIQYTTTGNSNVFAVSVYARSADVKSETLEYTVETFYPSRISGREPVVKHFEEISGSSFVAINREMLSVAGSLKQSLASSDDW